MKLPYRFNSMREAEFAAIWLLHELEPIRYTIGHISLGWLYEKANEITMLDYKSNFKDYTYGWTREDDFYIMPYRKSHWGYSEYGLELPEPKLI